MLDNATRRQLLERHKSSGFPGSIIDVYNAHNQGIDLISQFEMSNAQVANTPQQQQEGLRPFHQQGQTDQSMVFPNVPANTSFNTVGMKAPINIKKIDNQGNLVKSYENVPPGIHNLPTGPVGGTVIETPANMQSGGIRKYQSGAKIDPFSPRAIAQQMADRFGGTADTYLALGDTVAYHESAHTMNPKMRQYEGGPGRGAFQIEPASMERLQNRVKAYANQHGYPVPRWINVPNNDARNLTLDQQMSLFLLDMAASSGTNMKAYAEGRSSTQEQWLKGWKRKPSPDGLDYQRFRTSADKAKVQGIPNASAMPSNIPLRITTRASAAPKPAARGVIQYDPSKLTLGSIIPQFPQ